VDRHHLPSNSDGVVHEVVVVETPLILENELARVGSTVGSHDAIACTEIAVCHTAVCSKLWLWLWLWLTSARVVHEVVVVETPLILEDVPARVGSTVGSHDAGACTEITVCRAAVCN
jgi:hypothetical protein